MTISLQAAGTIVAGTTSVAPAYPTGVASGRWAELKVITKPDTATIRTPTGWIPLGQAAGGAGTTGIDVGPMRAALFGKILSGSESGTVTVTIDNGNSSQGVIDIYNSTVGFDVAAMIAGAWGADTASDTSWSAACGFGLNLGTGDLVVGLSACASNTSATITSQALSATGATFGAVANARTGSTNNGNDCLLETFDFPVSSGSSNVAPTYTATHGAANTGVTVMSRLRESATPTAKIHHRCVEDTINTIASGSWVGTKPADIVNGSVLIAALDLNNATVTAVPTGWFQIGTAFQSVPRVYLYYHVVNDAPNEPASWSWTLSASVTSGGCVADYRGVDTNNVEDVTEVTSTAASSPGSFAGLNPVTSGAMLLYCMGVDAGASTRITHPTAASGVAETTGKRCNLAEEYRSATGASGTRAWSWGPTTALAGCGVMAALRPAPSQQLIALNQATETDTAQPFGRRKQRVLNQVTEQSTAQPFGRQKVRTLGLTTEQSTAQPFIRRKVRVLGQATETSTAQPLTVASNDTIVALNTAVETSTAQAFTRRKVRVLNQATETSAAQATTGQKRRALLQATEASVAQPFGRQKRRTTGIATESSTAQPFTRRKVRVLGQAVEQSVAQHFGSTINVALNRAIESSSALPFSRSKQRTLSQAVEVSVAQPITKRKIRVLVQATELSTAQQLRGVRFRPLNTSIETDVALAFVRYKKRVLGQAVELSIAQPMIRFLAVVEPWLQPRGELAPAAARGQFATGAQPVRGSTLTAVNRGS